MVDNVVMTFTHEEFLRNKENRIKKSIHHGESVFTQTFDFLHKYYTLKDLSGDTPILCVFEAIYIQNVNIPSWKLAIKCNLSRTTLFNYRNQIVKDFYTCIDEHLIEFEVATTKEE